MAGTTIVDRLNKLSGKDATTIPKALEYLEEEGVGGDVDWNVNDPDAKGYISNRPFYEYDDYEEEEVADLLELLGEEISGLEYTKYTESEKTFYQTNVYTNYTIPNFRESFEEGEEYNLVFGTNSTVIPSFETGYNPAVFDGSSDWEGATIEYENQVTFHNNHNHKSVELCAMTGGYRDTAVIFAGFDVDDDGTLPKELQVTSIKAYKRVPVKKVKKIDEKYLPIKGLNVHICTSAEYDSSTHIPTVTNPDASTLYLVPTSSKSKNMFDEYVWTGTDWEKFGTGSVALPSPTTTDNGKVLGVDGGEYKLVEQSGGAEVEYQKLTHNFIQGDIIGIKIGRLVILKFIRVKANNDTASGGLIGSKRITVPSGWMPAEGYTTAEGASKNGQLCITQVAADAVTTRYLTPHFAFVSPHESNTISVEGFNESTDPQYVYFIDGELIYICAE